MSCCSPRALPDGGEVKRSTGYKRTFMGCWRCRERKIKCDNLQPSCSPCRRTGLQCTGYRQNLVWVAADQKTYRHNGRRYLEPYHTWRDIPILSSGRLDDLIRDCDIDHEGERDEILCLPFSTFRVLADPHSSWHDDDTPEYSVTFDSEDVSNPSPDDESSLESCSEAEAHVSYSPATSIQDLASVYSIGQGQIIESESSADFFELTIPPSIRAESRLNPTDAGLFNVYLTAVAPTLVPVHEARNPWLRYPAIALHLSFQEGRNHLLHALMAHAAFCLGHNGFQQDAMTALGTKLYSLAMTELRAYLREASPDYVGLLTTILTFLLLELSRGSSKAWRYHLQAAWDFLQHHQNSKEWLSSADAWYVTQSFHLLKTSSDSCGFTRNDPNDAERSITNGNKDELAEKVMCNPGYGWTLGTSSSVMETITDINAVATQLECDDADISTVTIPLRVNQTLLRYQREVLGVAGPEHQKREPHFLHLQAFQAATLIYYYQTCEQLSPRQLSHLVSAVLGFLSAFFEICGGSFTLWPVFVAAAEAYEEDDQLKFITLLERVGTVGMRNMSNYKTLLERIWKVRRLRAAIGGRETADVRVDWREVMRELEMDVLIL